jgi:hypothetical protein
VSGIYYAELADVLRAAGVEVGVGSQNVGWETRARSSGGFPSPPLAVFWHHTASETSIENDLAWQCHGCDDAPVGNMTIARDGVVWPVAAGASNCAGKGGPATFSRGTIPADSGNTRGFNIEVAAAGTPGHPWPVAQIDAYFRTSNALNELAGNLPTDVISHALGAGDGWTDRKIDPATAADVEGPWRPSSVNGSGTWSLADIRAECSRRSSSSPGPIPRPIGDDMAQVIKGDRSDSYYAWNGVTLSGIPSLEWVQWGSEAGLYANTVPVLYPQGFVDELLAAQGER